MIDIARVAAVIVTHNRLAKLRRSIAAVRGATHTCEWIIVVDNASSDGTAEYLAGLSLAEPRLVVLRLDENLGGAGGFEHGMAAGHRLGADFVWVMDDDCTPDPRALEVLLGERERASAALSREVAFACSVVEFTDGSLCRMNQPKTSWDWASPITQGLASALVTECTFISVLVARWAIDEAGLPLGEYFIWYDDKEFTRRLKRRFGPGILAFASRVVHDMPANIGVNYRQVTPDTVWKFEKGARNRASFKLRHEGRLSYLAFCLKVWRHMRQGRVPGAVQWRIARALGAARSFDPQPRFPDDARYDRHDAALRAHGVVASGSRGETR